MAQAPVGKFFVIRSHLNGLVLGIKDKNFLAELVGDAVDPGQHVVTSKLKKVPDDEQLWYLCDVTGTIRSKVQDFCLDIHDKTLIINKFNKESNKQKWTIQGKTIRHKEDGTRVLDIAGANKEEGARVCLWKYGEKPHQHWDIEYQPPQYFVIKSMHCDKVMDIRGADVTSGARVIIYTPRAPPSDNQLWYEDNHGVICSKLNGFSFEPNKNSKIVMKPVDDDIVKEGFIFMENCLVKRTDHTVALDIEQSKKDDGSRIMMVNLYHGSSSQKWQREYIKMK